jgi:pyrroloquinoline-quinone synthase
MDKFTECVSQYHLLKHPFYQDWMAGNLSSQTLKDYATQYYPHVDAFPRYLSSIHSQCDNPEARQELLKNLADEEGFIHGVSHPELWLRFAEGIGVPRSEVLASKARSAIKQVTETFFKFCRSSFHEGLGALYAYESQVPEIAESKIEGLRAHYGVHDERALSFFETHRTADVHHREAIAKILDKLPADQKMEALQAAELAARSLWNFLTEIHERRTLESV